MMKKILLCVTGSIACYKGLELLRLLQKNSFDIRVVMTTSAKKFVVPLSFEVLSEYPVYDDLWAYHNHEMAHISLAKWPDLIVIAPATANTIAKIATGLADNLLCNIVLATQKPVIIAPAMNQQMYEHISVSENIKKLSERGYQILDTARGKQACGDIGKGKILPPRKITEEVLKFLDFKDRRKYNGLSIVVTAGPTIEPIDPIRFISNHSSGKMGYAIAEQLQHFGSKVILISGPTNLISPYGIKKIDVKTACEMYNLVNKHINKADIFISTAAVSDFRPISYTEKKIKKSKGQEFTLRLIENKDILKSVSLRSYKNRRPFCVGFAAETENSKRTISEKITRKNIDILVFNRIDKKTGYPFYQDSNSVDIYDNNGVKEHIGYTSKEIIARKLANLIIEEYKKYMEKGYISNHDQKNLRSIKPVNRQ